MAANGHRSPAPSSHGKPHIACSGGTLCLIWPHLATLRLSAVSRLTGATGLLSGLLLRDSVPAGHMTSGLNFGVVRWAVP
jgi:hypothetical protein